MSNNKIAILGIFVADTTYLAGRLPEIGETLPGSGFILGPGGKGSNQAVAAARAGAEVSFISRLGDDAFGAMARDLWHREGIRPVVAVDAAPTGAAMIFVNDTTGENAIIVYSGAAANLSPADLDAARAAIEGASVFICQLEQPAATALRGLEIARAAKVTTIFNPAPAVAFDPAFYPLVDYITPNETETTMLTGIAVDDLASARQAADVFLARGVGAALITLGVRGALLHSATHSLHIPVISAGETIDTTGAGDAFNGAFAAALARGELPEAAARFAAAAAGISVTRRGAAASMPTHGEAHDLLSRHG